jgi:hypothetical protein
MAPARASGKRKMGDRGERDDLAVSQTKLHAGDQRAAFNGLFTNKYLQTGAFVGFYTGRFYETRDDDDDDDVVDRVPTSRYAMSGSVYTVVPKSTDAQRYPMAMINEPPKDALANVFVVEWPVARDAVPQLPPAEKVEVLAIHTTRPVCAGEELYLHYGKEYDRHHYPDQGKCVGIPSRVRRSDIPLSERPSAYLSKHGRIAPTDAFVCTSAEYDDAEKAVDDDYESDDESDDDDDDIVAAMLAEAEEQDLKAADDDCK